MKLIVFPATEKKIQRQFADPQGSSKVCTVGTRLWAQQERTTSVGAIVAHIAVSAQEPADQNEPDNDGRTWPDSTWKKRPSRDLIQAG